ncbi:MAG: PLP-dependent cysteine synthase family protein [Halobacteriales archaeon]
MAIEEATIGDTPLVELALPVEATVYAKLEWYNLPETPYGGGSVKSRIAKAMLDAAEAAGELPGPTIIEPSSGNTGSEVAKIGTSRGYDVEIVMPDNAAGGKINAIRDAGASIHFVDADKGYDAVLERCEELLAAAPEQYYRPNQYANPANPGAHERTTGPEIWTQTDGSVSHFIAGVGTGGTLTGTGRALHDRGDVEIVGIEPAEPLHAIDGLKFLRRGDQHHPETYVESVLDEKLYIDTGAAYDRARELRERYLDREMTVVDRGQHTAEAVRTHLRVQDQFLVGTSSGAAVAAVYELAEAGQLSGDDVVVLLFADRGDKYADIPLWEEYLNGH